MENQGSNTSNTPSPDRETQRTPASLSSFSSPQHDPSAPNPQDLSPTTPTVASTPTRNPLSTSEPSLRFPLPQGNRRLANWVSSSNPDIMRVTTTTEDTGLSESTYELVSGTDTESQDGNYTESISESIGSLDFHRPDDVHSLAGTEHTYDDESVADDAEPRAQTSTIDHERLGHASDTTPLNSIIQDQHEPTSIKNDASAESESEDEARSRSSLEYTQQSLKIPSIPAQDASRTTEPASDVTRVTRVVAQIEPVEAQDQARVNKWLAELWDPEFRLWDSVVEAALSALPGIIFALIVASLIPVFYSPPSNEAPTIPAATSVVTPPPTSLAISSTSLSSVPKALSTSLKKSDPLPLENVLPEEWFFTGKQPDLAVSKRQGAFLVHMPRDAKDVWMSKNCLNFEAKRGEDPVRMTVSSVEDGILMKFPYDESHGTVRVDISTTCRPKIRRLLRVTFERGIMEDVLELTKNFAQDLNELVPVAAQEAERCIEGAKRCLGTASDSMLNMSDTFLKGLAARFSKAHQSLGPIKTNVRDRMQNAKEFTSQSIEGLGNQLKQRLPLARDVQNQAHLGLLDAQIAAKLWWLKIRGAMDEHHRYQQRAKEFMAGKLAKATQGLSNGANEVLPRSPLWAKLFPHRAININEP